MHFIQKQVKEKGAFKFFHYYYSLLCYLERAITTFLAKKKLTKHLEKLGNTKRINFFGIEMCVRSGISKELAASKGKLN